MTGSDESGAGGQGPVVMSAAQSRAARAMLGWSQGDLAARVGLGEDSVLGFESGVAELASGQIEALRSALTAAGLVFADGAEPGVRLAGHGGDEGVRPGALTTENDR